MVTPTHAPTCAHTHTRTHARTHSRTLTRTHTHTHPHTHTHTQVSTLVQACPAILAEKVLELELKWAFVTGLGGGVDTVLGCPLLLSRSLMQVRWTGGRGGDMGGGHWSPGAGEGPGGGGGMGCLRQGRAGEGGREHWLLAA